MSTTGYLPPVTAPSDLLLLHAVADVHIDPDSATGETCIHCAPARRAPVEARVSAAVAEVFVDACVGCAASIAAFYRGCGITDTVTVFIAPESEAA